MSAAPVLLASHRRSLYEALARRRHDVIHETEFEPALLRLEVPGLHAVVSDVGSCDDRGLELCVRAKEKAPDVPLVVLSSEADMELALAAMRVGASEFLPPSVSTEDAVDAIEQIVKSYDRRRRIHPLELSVSSRPHRVIGGSPAIVALMQLVERVACSTVTVCITGESGTGKELVARAIHDSSGRTGPFLPINCAALPEHLLESELFGHVRGAFTDATHSKKGLLLESHQGTVFFDEIGDMPHGMQAKLLRALQERVIRPVGSTRDLPFDARFVVATHRNLEEDVETGRFRADLFYRLCVVCLEVPPLRERTGDVDLLVDHFLRLAAQRQGRAVKSLTPAARAKLAQHVFPGNVRELANAIDRGVAVSEGDTIDVEHLPLGIQSAQPGVVNARPHAGDRLQPLCDVKTEYLRYVLERVSGNKSHAARILGLDRRTVQRGIERGLP
jgi:DNA-binding NtrC family response regulator